MTKRFLVILFGYLCSCFAATLLHFLVFIPYMGGMDFPMFKQEMLDMNLPLFGLTFSAYLAIMFIPAIVIIFIGEFLKFRGAPYYVLGSAVVMLFMQMAFFQSGNPQISLNEYKSVWGFGLVSVAVSIVYWFVAGRSAGNWTNKANNPLPHNENAED